MKRLTAALATTATLTLLLSACSGLTLPSSSGWQPPEVQVDESLDGLDRFTEQEPEWKDCGDGFECTRVGAPLDWNDPESETISLALVKKPATGTKLGTLFVNPGGPGSGGGQYVRDGVDGAVSKRLQESFDIVGWDPRGVGNSSAVYCYSDEELDEMLFGDPREDSGLEPGSDEWIDEAREEARDFADDCLEGTGPLLAHVDTHSTAQDLDLLRHLAGDEKLNYLGYSYGTFIGTVYADMFPERAGKLVLDGAIAPDVTMHEVVLMQQQGFEQAMRAYLEHCLAGDDCFFSGTVDDAMLEIGAMLDEVDRNPMQAPDGRWVSVDTFMTAMITVLYSESSWPYLQVLFEEVSAGETDTAQLIADLYYSREYGEYTDNSTVAFSAINCLDYPRGVSVEEMRKQAAEIAEAAPIFGKYAGYGDISCEEWPFPGFDDRGPMNAKGSDPIMVVGTTGDPATPYAWSKRLADQLDNARLLTYNGEGHTAYNGASSCVNDTVDDYFVNGTVPSGPVDCD